MPSLTVARFLYLAGRMDLRQTEHNLAAALVPVFWPGGAGPISRARLVVERLFERGVGSAPTWTTAAIRGLVERRVLEPTGPGLAHVYRLNDPILWGWYPGRLDMALDEWVSVTDGSTAWSGKPGLAYALVELLLALALDPTPHPADPVIAGWFPTVLRLADEYGDRIVVDALTEAKTDPDALVPATPEGFEAELYALSQRARRRRGDPGV